ncbi:hypothetical protein [Methyloglobulus sp.]|uniref:hypothetical protein n=1 Tax=Methyloglobulus sp. TaxID=2518622 RepID=UPI0032B850C3
MNNDENNGFVARCAGIATQRATNQAFCATNGRNDNATNSLKALAYMVLDRNTLRNKCATDTQKTAQQMAQKNTRFVARNCTESCVENNLILAAECNPEILLELEAEALPAIDGELLTDSKPPKMQVLEGEGTHLGAFVVHGDTWGHFEDADYRDAEPAKPAEPYPKPVTVWTPAGEPVQVMAKDAAHGQFLIAKNPKPVANTQLAGFFTCGTCQHFKPHHQHGKGSGSCTRHAMPPGICHWSETVTECNQHTGIKRHD